jgi:hypothetical protein
MAFTVFFLLIGAHALADYCIQGDAVAIGKNKYIDPARFGVNWYYWMFGHAFTQGLLVALVTQNAFIGLAEAVFHFLVDWLKCKKYIGIHSDQFLHFASKFVWVLFYFIYSVDNTGGLS